MIVKKFQIENLLEHLKLQRGNIDALIKYWEAMLK
jgi:hypothetical protein